MRESILDVAKRADLFFMQKSPIHEAMLRLTTALGGLNIPFAVAGAMAANVHGHKRTTADVDILIHRDDLQKFKAHYIGRGWVDKFEGSKNFRDAVCNVNIDALVVGEFPGDGKPKPVSFPSPESVAEVMEQGIPYISLSTLLELKLASGMTAVHRPRDLDDVIQLIRVNDLPREYSEKLNAYVRPKFSELWQAAQVNDDY